MLKGTCKAYTTLKVHRFEVRVRLRRDDEPRETRSPPFQVFEVACELTVRELDSEGSVATVSDFIDRVRTAYAGGPQRSPSRGQGYGYELVKVLKSTDERLAGGVVHIADEAVGARLERVKVTIVRELSTVEVNWKRGQIVPDFPKGTPL